MARAILLQLTVAVLVALVAAMLGGWSVGLSSMLAGLSCVVPNAVFAFGLAISDRKAHKPGSFYLWELLKILLTIALMVAVFWQYEDVNWLAYFVSFIVVLKSYIFILYKTRN